MGKADKDLDLYCKLMAEVKGRLYAALEILKGHTRTSYKVTNIEFVCLQIRKVLELISMCSLVVNQEEFDAIGQQYSNHWNAKLILKDIQRLNPDFYPVPIVEIPSKEDGVVNDLQKKESGYLTYKDFVKIYDKCNKALHTYNPFGSIPNLNYYESNVLLWIRLIMELLNTHLIHIKGVEGFYLIHMEERDNKNPHGYFFKSVN